MDHELKGVPIFTGLNEAALDLFMSHAKRQIFPSGNLIAREGETNNCMFVIAAGSVRVVKHLGQPHETELASLGPKDFFGEMCILEPLPRVASVQAIEETAVYGISSLSFLALYEELPGQYGILLLNIARDLSRRLRHLDEAFCARKA